MAMKDVLPKPPTRRRFLSATGAWLAAARLRAADSPPGIPARLGLLLDTSSGMGFLVPQARKELRLLNTSLAAAGRPPVILREIEGAAIDREGSTSVGARRNVIYKLKELYAEVDTVLWITALQGEQSPGGIFAVEELLKESPEGRPARQLVIRNIWPDQLQAGDLWVQRPPAPEEDPLDLRNRPEEWYRLVGEGRGIIQRSWQTPPPDFRSAFGFPHRIVGSAFLRKLGQEGSEAAFDQAWTRDLTARHGLRFSRAKEEWPARITGRRWLMETTLLPYPDEEEITARSAAVFESLSARESIEDDLARIAAEKLGVVFGFGYVEQDLKRHLAAREKAPRSWRDFHFADLVRIGSECARHLADAAPSPTRIYANERITLASKSSSPESPDPIIRRIARMVREDKVDAIYLFTNGYLGGGEYGTWTMDLNLLTLAIREAGTRLYVRIPFEFGPTPRALARLAMASGGGVFRGRADDPDWIMAIPDPAWPEPVEEV